MLKQVINKAVSLLACRLDCAVTVANWDIGLEHIRNHSVEQVYFPKRKIEE